MREATVLLLFLFLFLILAISSKAKPSNWWGSSSSSSNGDDGYCLSWRLAVEANNIRAFPTVPPQCLRHVESYMIGGQYQRDVALVVDTIFGYVDAISPSGDGLDAWVLDIDDTCISNLLYYSGKRYGCEPFDPVGFKAWAMTGGSPAIPDVLRLYNKLIQAGFKVFLITGRDELTLAYPTILNLHAQGFVGYHRLVLRSGEYKGVSASTYKSEVRKQLVVKEGYRIWGNVGDQWTDLFGDYAGNRIFKLPNPMYFVP